MALYQKNNLDKATSPYLQQHKNNPIHWQEWSQEVLDYAEKNKKPLFVSIGYATCHWCHVMAAEAFENKEIAAFLNEHFVCIKVDREQRPDIDQYFMSFLVEQQGSGGWPLNVFLTPDRKPIVAFTYIPVTPQYGMHGFLDIGRSVHELLKKDGEKIPQYVLSRRIERKGGNEEMPLLQEIQAAFDEQEGGFGHGPKFPPHNTLLFLLSVYAATKNQDAKKMLEKTLDSMAMKGLHDHLQGGFYRYCVDTAWTIPHFEKMLYDQALLLWVYSAAYKVLKKEHYKIVAEKIIQCLDETFEEEKGLLYSGHDADTEHKEGATYLWQYHELQQILSPEFSQFSEVYALSETGNFEGKNHLLKKKDIFLPALEKKLLVVRKKRKQPFVDQKIITSWNALAGIGLVMAWRCVGNKKALEKAEKLFLALLKNHYKGKKLAHSSLDNCLQEQEFLEDSASLLLLATYLYEEGASQKEIIEEFLQKVKKFQNVYWVESKNPDFMEIPAQEYDHPTPSSISLAECAVLRAEIILGKEYGPDAYKQALSHDFFNLTTFFRNGNFHIIHSQEKISWEKLPLHCMQLSGSETQECYKGKCVLFQNAKELLKNL